MSGLLECEWCLKRSDPRIDKFYSTEVYEKKRVLCADCYYHLKVVWCPNGDY